MRIAMAQCTAGINPDDNLSLIADYTASAAEHDVAVVVFGEAMMCRFGVPLGPVAQPREGLWARSVSEIAQRHGLTVVAGMFTPAEDGRVYNTLIAAHADATVDSYNKVHLYDAFNFAESDTVAPGDRHVIITVDDVRIGLATCYDIRFPAQFIELAVAGAQVMVVPSSWGAGPGKLEQWRVLAQARALDSGSIVVAVGQAEPADSVVRESRAPTGIGHSLIADATGRIIAECDAAPQLLICDLDIDAAATARATTGVLANRTPSEVAAESA